MPRALAIALILLSPAVALTAEVAGSGTKTSQTAPAAVAWYAPPPLPPVLPALPPDCPLAEVAQVPDGALQLGMLTVSCRFGDDCDAELHGAACQRGADVAYGRSVVGDQIQISIARRARARPSP